MGEPELLWISDCRHSSLECVSQALIHEGVTSASVEPREEVTRPPTEPPIPHTSLRQSDRAEQSGGGPYEAWQVGSEMRSEFLSHIGWERGEGC